MMMKSVANAFTQTYTASIPVRSIPPLSHRCYYFNNRRFTSLISSSSFNWEAKNISLDSQTSSAIKLSLSPIRASSASSTQNMSTADANPELDIYQLIQSHQEKAARLPPIEEVRTLLHHTTRGVLSTFSSHEGYPSASMVDFASDASGSSLLAVSSLADHTKDLLANPKCSLLVSKDPEDRTDLVIIVHGDAVPVSEASRESVRAEYLAKHPDAFWVDFGDFQFMRIEPKVVRYVSGVATALLGSGEFSKDEFAAAKVDPLYQFSKPITSHMNKDHEEDTKLIVQHSTSIPVESAYMLSVDSLGFNVKVGYQGNNFKLRIPFTRRASDRKDVKTLIVEMLQASRTTNTSSSSQALQSNKAAQ